MNYGELLISKIIDFKAPEILKNYNIQRHHFQTQAEREAYDFITRYVSSNRQTPDYRTLVANVSEDFTFMPNVQDSFDYLAGELKKYSAKVSAANLIQNQVASKFGELDGIEFLKWLKEETEKIEQDTFIKQGLGQDLSSLKDTFKEEYLKRKVGQNFKIWETPFPSLTEKITGFTSGDCIGIMAESGRGKTMLSILVVHHLLKQGANVLVKSYEVNSYLWLSRLFTIITAEQEAVYSKKYNQKVGLENRKILTGQLEETEEEYFFRMLDEVNNYYPGKLFLQCKGDEGLTRTLDDLERELTQHPEINAVFLDPFYGLLDVYTAKNNNRTAGGASELAASRFEILCGVHDVVGFYAVQATVEKSKKDEEGTRELKLPTRDQVKTSKRLLDIATVLLTWDSVDSIARIAVEKGRNGNEGFELELVALMDVGVIKEPPKGETIAAQFNTSIF